MTNKPIIRNMKALDEEIERVSIKSELLRDELRESFERVEFNDIGQALIKRILPVSMDGNSKLGIALNVLQVGLKFLPKMWILNKARKLIFR